MASVQLDGSPGVVHTGFMERERAPRWYIGLVVGRGNGKQDLELRALVSA